MEVKEFAEKIGMKSLNLLRAINPGHNPTQATINRLLTPFGLKLTLAPIPNAQVPPKKNRGFSLLA
jgi:DNA-binding phage protein